MKKEKLLLVFPDGVGIRNYLYTDVFKDVSLELTLFHAFDSKTIEEISTLTGIKRTVNIPQYRETIKEKFLRELICLTRLKHNVKVTQNPVILTNWKKNHSSLSKKIFYAVIEYVSITVFKYKTIEYLENLYQKAIRKNALYVEVKSILQKEQPDKLFCAHQRGLQCATIFAVAKDLGIKTSTVIFSWDNLPKARMALRADKYFVWSEYMKGEMKLYYPEIPQKHIFVTGTPQFEFYGNEDNIIPKNEYYAKYNLDLNKKIICFSGDDVLTSPDDPSYLHDIAEELVKNGMENEYQILLRRCPVDLSGRFDSVIEKFSELIKEAPPLWSFTDSSTWTTIYPLPEDVNLLVSTVYHSDVVVNVGSTMAFDFAMFGKPCFFINYDQKKKNDPDWSVHTIYQFQHFKSMPNKDAVIWLNSKESFVNEIRELKPTIENINLWKETVLGDYKKASETILNNL